MAKLGPVDAPLVPTLILVAGGYTMWFAIHYWRDTAQAYPSGPVKAVLTGKGLPKPVREGSAADPNAAALGNLGQTLASSATAAANASGQAAATAGGAVGNLGSTFTGTAPSGIVTPAEMVSFWTELGGDPAQAQYAAGVMMAESSGDPNSTSSNPDGGINVGLFQLDTKGFGAGHTVAELKDPTLNTRITIMATRNGTDWADWADPYVAAHGTHGAG